MKNLSFSDRAAYCKNVFAKKLFHLMDEKKSNLALSADVTEADDLLHLAKTIGSEVCVLKTHIDILSDFHPDVTHELEQIAKLNHFYIFEDRKFADIGNTVKHQYQNGIYKISDWAHIINAHSLPGPGLIKGLAEIGLQKQRGLLLLAQMSSADNLITDAYLQKTLAMAEMFGDFVFGFICQQKISAAPHWVYMTPGIQFDNAGDNLGQQYITPQQAILENGSDIIIVGRGILNAANPKEAAQNYRAAGWQAHQCRLGMV